MSDKPVQQEASTAETSKKQTSTSDTTKGDGSQPGGGPVPVDAISGTSGQMVKVTKP
ncbi:hypothetical protein FOMA001_g9763 [Fusarium oxysporum f. sp. matthiolae]|nr:hypothetical protein FOMA001_g9763 [Fusarium oxysporum f. sp. matthiolae]